MNVGLDYLGPSGIKSGKVWVCLFTCSVTRAVHLETVEDCSAEAFLNTLKRFIATRGTPKRIISDNGSNFVRSAKALRCLWESFQGSELQEFMSVKGLSWSFNVPRASWWGGQFERLIRVVKECLKKTLNNANLSLFGFMTLIKEIEAIVNSRPLTIHPESPLLPERLTPGHFLSHGASLLLPSGSIRVPGEREDQLSRLWKAREKLLSLFWTRWRDEYLLLLRSAHQRRNSGCSSLSIGDIVLIDEPKLGRSKWKLGRVEEVIRGKDGVPRSCKLKTQHGICARAFQSLYKLL